jgi:multidrug resistance efflux pump
MAVHSRATLDHVPRVIAASPGRIEGASEAVRVGAGVDGVVEAVLVKEGQFVSAGTVMARLGCSDLGVELKHADAEWKAAEQRRSRLLAGSRPEERALAAQKVETVKAVLEEASKYYERVLPLAAKDVLSQAALDKARRDVVVAQSQVQEAVRYQSIIDAPPLKEDLARADAEADAAVQMVRVWERRLEKCVVRAPISGTVTRSYANTGESFSTAIPHPLFVVSDIRARRVRAEVDERDIASVEVGQKTEVTADAFAGRTFRGIVIQTYPALGRKTVMTGDPSERSDRDVLEVVVLLQSDSKILPLGLRVAVQFLQTGVSNE